MKSISLIFCTTILTLLGCSSESTPNNDSEIPAQANQEQNNSQIEGLWNITLVNDDNTIDERSLFIPKYGTEFTFFDYQGDSHGTGENCHTVFTASITHIENTEYTDPLNRPVNFSNIDSTTLIQINVDEDDQDNDGDTTDLYTQHWPLVGEGVSPSDYFICQG